MYLTNKMHLYNKGNFNNVMPTSIDLEILSTVLKIILIQEWMTETSDKITFFQYYSILNPFIFLYAWKNKFRSLHF